MTITESVAVLPNIAANLMHREYPTRLGHAVARLSHADWRRATDQIAGPLQAAGFPEYIHTEAIEQPGTDEIRLVHSALISHGPQAHSIRVTTPLLSSKGNNDTIVMLPGIRQDPFAGGAKELHDHVAEAFPEQQIVSISTDGVGSYEPKLPLRRALFNSFHDMSRTRLDITERMSHDDKVYIIARSMGTVLATRMVEQNMQSRQVDLQGAVFVTPALVPPEKARRVMGREFPAHIFGSHLEAQPSSRYAIARMCIQEAKALPVACYGNALQLSRGIEMNLVEATARETQLGLIYGDKDPLGQPTLYTQLADQYPNNVSTIVKRGMGHSIEDHLSEITEDIASLIPRLPAGRQIPLRSC